MLPAALGLIEAISIFSVLSDDERQALATSATPRSFSAGEEIVRKGSALDSLMIIKAGIVTMRDGDDEVARLTPGDFFGEQGSLAGVEEIHTLQAVTRVTAFELDQKAFAPLLKERPELADELAANLAHRENAAMGFRFQPAQPEHRRLDLLKRIRSIFRICPNQSVS
ncbi:Crp/Fnr family transcriptional regulator [Rhizobium grahamii]|uniref:Cyclic nucleotide-binding domain-containing protein n=1 Tax=Rhizobium grahamii TaxID=1120045 RepID=A0A370KNX0_9HYPH|nr:cyclic nucleotide-binding domain-containing protein [Rhizobium grahamii]RDJ10597.1 hypothetical protein B5K06_16360 [Rhizobium grahamii]